MNTITKVIESVDNCLISRTIRKIELFNTFWYSLRMYPKTIEAHVIKNQFFEMKRGEIGEIAYRVIHIRNIGSRDKAQYRWKKIKNITNVGGEISAFTSAQGSLAVTFKDVKISFSKVEDWQKPLQHQ